MRRGPSSLAFLFLPLLAPYATCAEPPTTPTPTNFTYYLFSAVIASFLAKILWDQRRSLAAIIGMKKPVVVVAVNKKDDNPNASGARQVSDLEAKISTFEQKIEGLQKSLRDKESAIAELKDKTVKQEKKINDTTRAKSALEKDATVKEIKERILQQQQQQQKKDDQTRARLALPDSPIAKAVLDETIKENKDLHLRIQAMVMQAQEEKKTVAEISQMVDNYKRELALAESRNQALEQELQAAKAETLRIQKQIAHLRDPLTPGHFTSHTSSTTDIPTSTSDSSSKTDSSNAKTKSSPVKLEVSPAKAESSSTSAKVEVTPTTPTAPTTTSTPTHTPSQSETTQPKSQPTTPRAPYTVPPLKPTSQMNVQVNTQPTSPTPISPSSSTNPISPRTNGIPSQNKEPETTTSTTSPRDALAELQTYDLSTLAKELDEKSLPSSPSSLSLARSLADSNSNSLSDLMDSLDNSGSPMQALDFISLAQDKNLSTPAQPSLMSPTARVEMRSPFGNNKNENEYDKDFISMFSPPGNTNLKRVRTNPTLNNLFYTDDASPPSFNLDGIDKDFLVNNPDSELASPRSQPQSPSHFEPAAQGKRGSPSPTAASFALHRSSSVSPPPPSNNHEEYPTIRPKGAHKSIFSVFGNENTSGTDPTVPQGAATSTPGTTTQPPHSQPPPHASAPTTVHNELLLSFGSKVDTNKAGLRRAKKVNFAAFAKGKVKVEPTMEDVHFCIYPYMKSKSRALFAVFDGHAGRAAADEAAALFPKEFNLQLEACSQDVTNAFLKTYAAVDEAMKEYEYMGTTATVVYLWQKEGHKYLQASNVGDSTSFLCRNGVSVRLTVDHKPSAQEEKERMRQAGIEVSDNQTRINGLAVSRSLGNHFVKEQNIGMIAIPYVGECIEILPTDTHLIVASDGLWDVVSPQHAFDIIKGMEALPAASQLLSTALAHNKCNDNVSIIVVCLN